MYMYTYSIYELYKIYIGAAALEDARDEWDGGGRNPQKSAL